MKESNKLRTAVALVVNMLMSATALSLTPGKTRNSRIRVSRGRATQLGRARLRLINQISFKQTPREFTAAEDDDALALLAFNSRTNFVASAES